MKSVRRLVIALVLALLLPGGALAEGAVKNVILLIGDGMGFGQITAARLSLAQGAYSQLNLDTMPYTGLSINFAANNIITDSAAAATALATGFRTETGRLGVLPDGTPVQSILLRAKEMGKKTGIVATVSLTDATLAAFLVNADHRAFEREIAAAILAAEVDVLLGGGGDAFGINPFTKKPKSNALILQALEQGYTFVADRAGLLDMEITPDLKLIGLFIGGDMSFDITRLPTEPSLLEMAERALQVVSQEPQGFFLLIEGSRIDRAGHTNSIKELIGEMLMFDQVVGLALDFARANPGTLVVVTADHETGGLAITGGNPSGEGVTHGWAATAHTGSMVPIYAFGPGAERFTGTLQITEIPVRIAELMGIGDFPAAKEGQ